MTARVSDFLERADEWLGRVEERVNVAIGLALEIAHEVAEYEPKINQKNHHHVHAQKHGGQGHRVEPEPAEKLKHRLGVNDGVEDQIVGRIGEDHEAGEEDEVENQVVAFDVSDLMGDDRIDLGRLQAIQEGAGDQNIPEFFYQAHDAGRDHATAKYRPIENVGIFEIRFFAQGLDPLPHRAVLQRTAAPKFLNHSGTDNRHDHEKEHEIDDRSCGGCQLFLEPRKGQGVDQVGDGREHQPGQQHGYRKRDLGPDIGRPGDIRSIQAPMGVVGESPDGSQIGNEQRQEDQGQKGRHSRK